MKRTIKCGLGLALAVMAVLVSPALANEKDSDFKIPEIPKILQKVAFCESGGSHFDSRGDVILGTSNPRDVGLFQINLDANEKEAQKLGLDVYEKEDNIAFALHLYETRGLKPWEYSKPCWSKMP